MKTPRATLLLVIAMTVAVPLRSIAENRTVSWSPSTTYTDGTPFAAGTTVTYDVNWTTDAALSPTSIQRLASAVTGTSTTFDPNVAGMPRGQTVYITGDAVLNTGETSALATAYAWKVPALSSLTIAGPSSVNENGSATYTATARWSDNTTSSVTPVWSENSAYATIGTGGVLTTTAVTGNQTVTVSASYTAGGTTRTASQTVTIVDVPTTMPAPPENLDVSGPVSTSPSKKFRVAWNAVTNYADGTPITADSVTYTAYWTTDPSLSDASLQPLAPSTTGTSIDFDPNADGMGRNQRVYLTARARLASGAQSALAAPIAWKASNSGPDPPANGRIYKK